MAELASSMPTSGGLYYAAAVLAGPKYGPFAAWITGWSNWFVQVTGAPSVDYGCAAMILAAASIMNPDYVPTTWQTFLLTVFIMVTHACISSMPTLWIANFNSVGSAINIACLVITILIIPIAANGDPKFQSNEFAWGIQNATEWPDGVAVLMSFLAIIWTMSGYGRFLYESLVHGKTLSGLIFLHRRLISSIRRMFQCSYGDAQVNCHDGCIGLYYGVLFEPGHCIYHSRYRRRHSERLGL